jgi:hypothetical protein
MLCSEATFAVYLDSMLCGDCAPCPHDPTPLEVRVAEARKAKEAEEARRREEEDYESQLRAQRFLEEAAWYGW